MREIDFRNMLKSVFPDVPAHQINALVRHVKSKGKESKMDVLQKKLGGIL
jgi:hypothetical protein